jgi:hypothetical protein
VPRHRPDRLADPFAGAGEQGENHASRRKPRLAHEAPHARMVPQAAKSRRGKTRWLIHDSFIIQPHGEREA